LDKEHSGKVIHDMRSPFNGLMGLTECMVMMVKDAKKKEQLAWINKCSRRYLNWIDAVTNIEDMAAGIAPWKKEDVALGYVVQEACALLGMSKTQYNEFLLKDGVTLNDQSGWTETPMVKGYESGISRIIYNVIQNAIQYTEKGSVTVTGEDLPDRAVIHVEDTGIGMPQEDLQRIFEPFVVLEPRRLPGRFGLGLSVARECSEFMGGKIDVTSELGKGTKFSITFFKDPPNAVTDAVNKGPEGFGHYVNNAPLLDANRNQQRFLGVIAHGLIPAMMGCIGMSDLLLNNEPKKPSKKQLAMVYRSGCRIVEVMNLITRCTLIVEPVPLAPSEFQLKDVLEWIKKELDVAVDKRGNAYKKKGMELKLEMSDKMPTMYWDQPCLTSVLYQLGENGLKFSNKGTVSMKCTWDGGERFQFTCTDSEGCGFKNEDFPFLTVCFWRMDPEKYYGLGMGLRMVRDILNKVGGKMKVDCPGLDQGSTFTLDLPVRAPDLAPGEGMVEDEILAPSTPAPAAAEAPPAGGEASPAAAGPDDTTIKKIAELEAAAKALQAERDAAVAKAQAAEKQAQELQGNMDKVKAEAQNSGAAEEQIKKVQAEAEKQVKSMQDEVAKATDAAKKGEAAAQSEAQKLREQVEKLQREMAQKAAAPPPPPPPPAEDPKLKAELERLKKSVSDLQLAKDAAERQAEGARSEVSSAMNKVQALEAAAKEAAAMKQRAEELEKTLSGLQAEQSNIEPLKQQLTQQEQDLAIARMEAMNAARSAEEANGRVNELLGRLSEAEQHAEAARQAQQEAYNSQPSANAWTPDRLAYEVEALKNQLSQPPPKPSSDALKLVIPSSARWQDHMHQGHYVVPWNREGDGVAAASNMQRTNDILMQHAQFSWSNSQYLGNHHPPASGGYS